MPTLTGVTAKELLKILVVKIYGTHFCPKLILKSMETGSVTKTESNLGLLLNKVVIGTNALLKKRRYGQSVLKSLYSQWFTIIR